MQKEDVWNAYVKRNPSFQTGEVSFTANGIRKFFDQTWDLAYKQGIEDADGPIRDSEPKVNPGAAEKMYNNDSEVADFLKGLFSGGKH